MTGDTTIARVPITEAFVGNATVPNLLLRTGFRYLDELTECTAQDLHTIRGCGEKTVSYIEAVLLDHGLGLHANSEKTSPIMVTPDGTSVLRSLLANQKIRTWIRFNDNQDLVSSSLATEMLVYGLITFQQFMDANADQRRALYTSHGIRKIEAFITEHSL